MSSLSTSLRPVDEVTDQLLGLASVSQKTETRSLDQALNCCLAVDVVSLINVPPADNSAMDGYAVNAGSVQVGGVYRVSDRIPAGQIGRSLEPGTIARIFTGAHVPDGADTVIMQENTELVDDQVRVLEMPSPGENVRIKGQDIQAGVSVVRAGDRITPRALSLIASVGMAEVEVYSPLKVAIMSTGDELVEPGEAVLEGQIYNSNRYALAGMLKNLGMEVVDIGIVGDTPEETESALKQAAAKADCILSSGGVSVGEEDHVKAAVERLGKIDVWKLAIKPGKPLAFGEVSGVPFFGLPGNPVSTFVTFHMMARPYLLRMQGFRRVKHESYVAAADFDLRGSGRREYIRVQTYFDAGILKARKFANQGSGIMTSVVWADALAEIEIGQQVQVGDQLKLFPLSGV